MSSCLRLKKSNCKNCYKCIRNCPVKSIRFSAGQANIIGDDCILCGRCFVVCPQGAKEIVNDTEKVRVLLQGNDPVYVSLAPSFIANYEGCGIDAMAEALMQLGFAGVEETAIGATMVKREYERILEEENRDIVISSCCHSINLLIRKYFPNLLQYLADVHSPMQAHCLDIKRRVPNAKTVFIGPCVAKKDEADYYKGIVDATLTFEEVTEWLNQNHIEIKKECDNREDSKARFFPTTGGILKTMKTDQQNYTYLCLDGVENCISALKEIERGNIHNCFIEMSACTGSCVGGPIMEKYHKSPVSDYLLVSNYAGAKDFDVAQPEIVEMKQSFDPVFRNTMMPSETEIKEILHQMGKNQPSDELNCGSCGYNTCREKAAAIYQGKADVSMCLPFLKDKAENLSDTMFKNSPNALIILNDKLEVQQINEAALKLTNLNSATDVLGDQVIRILEPSSFMKVRDSKRGIYNQRAYLAEYKRFVVQTIVPADEGRNLLCIMRDVTDEEDERIRKEEISRQTIEVADSVVDKQMRIVQEIASLLGETAAETKIALSKLKESIADE
ncbi:MAG: [Fe-Fe] hydrogenase large subunit C-terminal domain-containing protein [Lachnospiraceae bacterium]|nr:[Fe-Fe] hydrogenase large subunit C-terminal domain-containing protein [Lachnospiraceae bacterium]